MSEMNIPIIKENVDTICRLCSNFKGVIRELEPLKDVLIIKCVSSGEENEFNCDACTGSLTYIGKKYGAFVTLYIAEAFSK